MRFLVSGGSGFVGSVLINELRRSGNRVIEIGRRSSGRHLDQFFPIKNFSADTSFKDALVGCEVILHLAARVHVIHEHAADALREFLEVNLHGTTNLARQAAAAGVKRFVYVSSIKVNGEYTAEQPFTESDYPNPQDPYAVSKWQAEQALHEVSRETGMEVVIVRPPLVYGPGVKANFYQLLKMVDLALPLPLGSITNRRSMVYLENLVDALILCATHPKACGRTYLVSDGAAISTPELVTELAHAMQRPCRIFPFPLSLMRGCAGLLGKSSVLDRLAQSLEVDSSKICKELGWAPPHTMQQGFQATVEWFLASGQVDRAG